MRKVFLAASWRESMAVADALSESIEAIRSVGAEVTIVLSNARIEGGPSCPIRSIMYGNTPNCANPRAHIPKYFEEIRSRYPTVQFIDPNEVICDDERCDPVLAGTLLYRDKVHLNDIGSRLIGQRLLDRGVRLQ